MKYVVKVWTCGAGMVTHEARSKAEAMAIADAVRETDCGDSCHVLRGDVGSEVEVARWERHGQIWCRLVV